jgi:hypothetical protein
MPAQRPSKAVRARKGDDPQILMVTACEIIGCSPAHLKKLAAAGKVGTWTMLGARVRYSKADCERARDEAFRPATANELQPA